MPIPQNPDYFLAQVVMKPLAPSTNTFVNTWFFRNETIGGPPNNVADAIRAVLDAFYDGLLGGARITSFLSPVIQRSTVQYRIYDLGAAAPRLPLIRTPAVVWQPAGAGSSAMPNEVAAVLSYRSGATGGQGGTLNKRARGRLFLGPLTTTAAFDAVGQTDATMSSTLRSRIVAGALDVKNTSQPVQWSQYSRVANQFQEVSGGFVDDRFDTQRRRGEVTSTRQVW